MEVDHVGKYWLTNFGAKVKRNKVTTPDHFPVILVLDLSYKMAKPNRNTHFNFKDPQGQMSFFNMTNDNRRLAETFSTNDTFKNQVSNFEKSMNRIFHQVFPKIRERKRKFKEDEVGYLIERRKKLKLNPPSQENEKRN